MDLRDKNFSLELLKEVHQFIIERKLAYQPFIFTDTLEVGEGLRFHDGENEGGDVYWEDADPRVQDLLVTDISHFRKCNCQLRIIYEHFLDTLVAKLGGDISQLTFAEIGCNTGYFLHGLALRTAKRCIGYDFTNNDKVFEFFNKVLGINNEFHFAEWDSLKHSLNYAELPEVDVILSVAVTCHLADPIYHLAYLCDHAKKAIFIYSPVHIDSDSGLSISFGQPAKYPHALDYPLSFDNDVRPSVSLIKMTLEEAGFGEIHEVKCPEIVSEKWKSWYSSQRGYIAFRTRDIKTALSPDGRKLRTLPPDVSLESQLRIQTESHQQLTQLQQAQATIAELQTESHQQLTQLQQAQATIAELQTESHQQLTQLQQAQATIAELQTESHQQLTQLQQAQAMITAMKTSKFWKLRTAWFRFKKAIGLPADN